MFTTYFAETTGSPFKHFKGMFLVILDWMVSKILKKNQSYFIETEEAHLRTGRCMYIVIR